MNRKNLTSGLLVILLAVGSLGLLQWVHHHDACHEHDSSQDSRECAVCLALSATGKDKAAVVLPMASVGLVLAERSVQQSFVPSPQLEIVAHFSRGPPHSA